MTDQAPARAHRNRKRGRRFERGQTAKAVRRALGGGKLAVVTDFGDDSGISVMPLDMGEGVSYDTLTELVDALSELVDDLGASGATVAVNVLAEGLMPKERAAITEAPMRFTKREWKELEAAGLAALPRTDRMLASESTVSRFARLLAESVDVKTAAALLAVNESRVRQRLNERTLLGKKIGNRWSVLGWQFVDGQEVPGLAAVAAAFPPKIHPVAAWRFMTSPDPDLRIDNESETPLDWLRSGGDPEVVAQIASEL